jgi:N-6 DNA methylase
VKIGFVTGSKELKMTLQSSYFDRLWTLAAGRSLGRNNPAEALHDRLEADFAGSKELFSAEEYKDPAFSEALLGLLVAAQSGSFVPKEVANFMKAALGPGRVLSLYSGLGELLYQFGSGIGVEPVTLASKWSQFLMKVSAVDARVVSGNPLHWESDEKFDRIVCNPPFGDHEGELVAIEKALSLLSKEGQLAVIVPPNLLWGARQEETRGILSSRARVCAVIALPANVFPHTRIQSAILILEAHGNGATYMASSKNVADLKAVADDYRAWRKGQKFTLGFEATLDSRRWDVSYLEPIDFGLGDISFPYEIIPLAKLARIDVKRSDTARIAVHRWGKVVWLDDTPDSHVWKSNFFLTPLPTVNALYLYLYLSSSVGKHAIGKRTTGTTVPNISQRYLGELPVIVPDLQEQSRIVEEALKIRQVTSALEALAIQGRQSLSEKLFCLEDVSRKFLEFSQNTEKVFYQSLPFPIAVVYRKIVNAPNSTQRFSLLIELFEVVVRFIVLVNLADYLSSAKVAEAMVQEIPDIGRLSAPTLGDWVSLFNSLSHHYSGANTRPFLEEIKDFKLERYARTLREFVNIRNDSLRGHGSTLTETEYEIKFQEHSPKLYKLIEELGFLANYRLVKTAMMEKHGDFFKISVQNLMGDNPHFTNDYILQRTPLDTNKVVYLNSSSESLVLDPYIVLELCPECKRAEVLLLDKFMGQKTTYLAYESGHKPSFTTSDQLPFAVRELASRRYSAKP